jgi:hypothetical protein
MVVSPTMKKGNAMVDMDVLIERKCPVSHRWFSVARFELGLDALDAAKALSQLDGSSYRVVDNRWPDEKTPLVTVYEAGEFVA